MRNNKKKHSRLYNKLIASGLSNRKIDKILSPKNKAKTKKSFFMVLVDRITSFICLKKQKSL